MVPLFSWLSIPHAPTFETNGQIGDFVGGLLNPVIALMALFWLKKGVELQQKELLGTKAALEATEQHQAKQVTIAAVTGLLVAVTDEYKSALVLKERAATEVAEMKLQLSDHSFANKTPAEIMKDVPLVARLERRNRDLEDLTKAVETLASERGDYVVKLKKILGS